MTEKLNSKKIETPVDQEEEEEVESELEVLFRTYKKIKNGQVKANVARAEIEGQGKTLEELFFEVTEGIEASSVRTSEVDEQTDSKEETKAE